MWSPFISVAAATLLLPLKLTESFVYGGQARTPARHAVPQEIMEQVSPEVGALAVGTFVTMCGAGAYVFSDYVEKGEMYGDDSPYPRGVYDRFAAAAFFERRPMKSLSRLGRISFPALRFGLDYVRGVDDPNRLVEELTHLGPTFIKVGQALSIRSDLLPARYCDALATLQDRVPPFETAIAQQIIREDLGTDSLKLGDGPPIASASLGQVYKTQVKKRDVAVKVQRPDVVETIALDLHLLRTAAPVVKFLGNLNTDLPGIVDAWGEKFVDELDYEKEGENARSFLESISKTPLSGVVFAPAVLSACSSKRVLTTEWVDGDRLDSSTMGDIAPLCSVAMNAYLTMMLETGILHADPHPGNLLVERNTNRLAILDWGLVTELDPGLRLAYIEHIAHLVAKDYEKVPGDLVKLGFVPAGFEGQIESSDAVEVLSDVYTQFAGGGGAAKIDVPEVIDALRGLADRQGNLFQLPPYFAYIARAFSVLEGIGLQNDPNYAIVQECLPYVSQRLVTDPQVATALETFIYDKNMNVDAKRVQYLLDGLGSYTQSTQQSQQTQHQQDHSLQPARFSAVETAERLADLLLDDEKASPTRAIVEREVAKLVGAAARTQAAYARDQPTARALANLLDPFRFFEPLATGPLFQPDTDDEAALAVFASIQAKAGPQLADALEDFNQLPVQSRNVVVRELVQILWERRDAAFNSARRLTQQLAQQTADRLLK